MKVGLGLGLDCNFYFGKCLALEGSDSNKLHLFELFEMECSSRQLSEMQFDLGEGAKGGDVTTFNIRSVIYTRILEILSREATFGRLLAIKLPGLRHNPFGRHRADRTCCLIPG